MKQAINMILVLALLVVAATGCGVKDTIYLEQDASSSILLEQNTQWQETEALEQVESEYKSVTQTDELDTDLCYVYICGAVAKAGVYQLPSGSRVCDVIALAGGMTENASAISINQAEQIWDGQMIFLPTEEEAAAGVTGDVLTQNIVGTSGNTGEQDERVNINTASAEQLMTLSGIGQSKANDIIAYREAHGAFSSIDEIMCVDGIKEGLYNRIKDDIRVK